MGKLSISLSAETTEREYKREVKLKKPKSWLKTVVAFSNGIGGTIYFGVNDDREIKWFYFIWIKVWEKKIIIEK